MIVTVVRYKMPQLSAGRVMQRGLPEGVVREVETFRGIIED